MGIMRSLVVLSVVLNAALAIPPLDLFHSQSDKIEGRAEDIEHRLSDDITPLEYDLRISNIDFDTFTFSGDVAIRFLANVDSSWIKMHSRFLTIRRFGGTIPFINETATFVPDLHFVMFEGTVTAGMEYTMTINYTGIIQDDMSGFYRSWYKEGDETVWLGSTQFQPVYARKVFPCFDEPKFKAVFKINIDCPTDYNCVSNMPERTRTGSVIHFHDTPVMSSYLIAFIVSKFVNVAENTTASKYRIFARPEAMGQGKYAFVTGESIVDVLGGYFNYSYSDMNINMKLDHAAIPDFSAGAMENWGLVTYREAYLMYLNGETSPRYHQQVATILAHEIVHMWFGNLVTCNWWSNTWLNEGFATYFQYFVSLESENMGLYDQFIVTQLQAALSADTSINSSPMSNDNVNTPAQISNHFSTISYQKGGSVIRMIRNLVGEEEFKLGLAQHLKVREFENAVPDDLFTALNDNADLSKYNTNVKEVMESWTSQSGYPLLDVTVNHAENSVTLKQERFTKEGETPPNTKYNIPITFTTDSEMNFDDITVKFVMKDVEHTFTEGFSHGWFMFNIQQSGYYRINYDENNWYQIAEVLKNNRTLIHKYNRAQIVDDAMNLAREGRMNYTMMLDIIEFLEDEVEYAPWQAAINGYSFLRLQFGKNETSGEAINRLVRNQMDTLVEDIGVDGEGSHLERLFRNNAMNLACNVESNACVTSATAKYKALMDGGTPVDPEIRESVYCNGLRHGGDAEYDFLWNKFKNENVVSEQVIIIGALGCTKREGKLNEYLTETLNPLESGIRDQDRMSAFSSAVTGNQENVMIVFEFVTQNSINVTAVYGPVVNLFSTLTSRMTRSQLNTAENYLNSNNIFNEQEVATVRNLIASARQIIDWAESKHEEVITWTNNKYNGAGSIVVSFSLLVSMLAALFSNY